LAQRDSFKSVRHVEVVRQNVQLLVGVRARAEDENEWGCRHRIIITSFQIEWWRLDEAITQELNIKYYNKVLLLEGRNISNHYSLLNSNYTCVMKS